MDSDEEHPGAVRPPFSIRQDPDKLEEFYALREGIPQGLLSSLIEWLMSIYSESDHRRVPRMNRTRVSYLERITDRRIVDNYEEDDLDYLLEVLYDDSEFAINAADMALQWADSEAAADLEEYLVQARSIFCVRKGADDTFQIEYRQPRELSELVEMEARHSDRASEHLRVAWSKCFGLNPDTKGACREAVSAVEVPAKPVVSPKNLRTTLGSLCRDMKADLSKWETDSEFDGSIETVLSMMEMVWNKGRYRHGDESAPLEVSQEAAEMTVQTAVLLVSWFRSGRIRLKSKVSTDSKNIK